MNINQKYISAMSNKMREILSKLMELNDDTPTSLSLKCGIPQPTIYRFLKGGIKDLKSSKAQKIAAAYSLNESQLRGDISIEDENFSDSEKVYRTNDPKKQAMIEMILALEKEEDSAYAEMSLRLVTKNVQQK